MEKEALYLAWNIVNINGVYYHVVFPVPTPQEIKKKSFSYPLFREAVIDYLSELSRDEIIKKTDEWAEVREYEDYEPALARVQIEYEHALRENSNNSDFELPDTYTDRLKQVMRNYYNEGIPKTDEELEEYYKKRKEEIETSSPERLEKYENDEILFGDLYFGDLRKLRYTRRNDDRRRTYCANIDMETIEELGIKAYTMTTREVYEYNQARRERKEAKRRKNSPKTLQKKLQNGNT